jgi:flagellar biogenesis protein FliO
MPTRDVGPLEVLGRASLSPRQAVTLVRVGDRVLILGTGPQGAPTHLGEVTDPAELARILPRRPPRPEPSPRPALARFDQRVGDDE